MAALVCWFMARPAFYAACVSTAGVLCFVMSLRPEIRQDMGVRAVVMTFFMPAIAWTLPNIWMLFAIMALWVPLFAGRIDRVAGVYLFALLLLPGLDISIEAGSLKLVDLGVHDALALGATLLIASSPDRARIAPADDMRVGVLLLVLIFIQARDTSATHFLRTTMNVALDFGLPYYILSRSLTDAATMRNALRWLGCGGIALASVLALELWRRWPIYNELYEHYQLPTLLLVKTRGALLRAGGPFNEPTSIALVTALCLVALWLVRDDFRSRLRHSLLCLLVFFGVSAPQSRNAWIALGIAVLLGDVFLGRWKALTGKVVPTVGAIVLILAAASVWPVFSDSLGLSGQASDTADYRRDLLDRGLEEFQKRPLTGYSNAELEVYLEDMRQGEGIIDYVNTYLWFGLFAGIFGTVVFVWNVATPLAQLWQLRRKVFVVGAQEPAAFVFGCIATLCVALFFASFGGRVAYLLIGFFGITAAIRVLCRQVREVEAAPPSKPHVPVWMGDTVPA